MGIVYDIADMVKKLENPPNRLREVRKAKGMTLRAVAAALGTTATVISRYETGERPVVMEQMRRLARLYCTDVGQLLNPEDNFTSLTDKERAVIRAMRFGPPHTADTLHAVAESTMRFQADPAEDTDAG